ncbi:MAG: hypothetical protein OK456_07780 [Thaumarchaeota archaeon]|nr:hypothetical protein [Nitrososphaerota archaeon]
MVAETLLSDMSLCTPSSALSSGPKRGRWRLIDYEAEGLKGKMLWANSKTAAPEVTLAPGVPGWHEVYLGIWDWAWSKVPVMITESAAEGGNLLKIRLSGEKAFTTIAKEYSDFKVEEVYWKSADLTGQSFVMGQQSEGISRRASLAYIRLVPLSGERMADTQREAARLDTKRLVAFNDGWSWIYENHPNTREDIDSQIVRYPGSDFGKVFYEAGYAAPQGLSVYDIDDFPRVGEEYANDSIRRFKAAGIDPFEEALRFGHSIGLEVFGSLRLGMPKTAPPFDIGPQDGGAFFLNNIAFQCVDRDGSTFPSVSYAFPEVRSHVVKAFEKPIVLGADGITALFHRGPPFVLYEQPLVDGFMAKGGEDPRKLPENDERWLRFRAGAMTDFMRELRKSAVEVSARVGREVPKVACVVFPTRDENLRYGVDVESFVKEGLVDYVFARDVLYATWEDKKADVPFFTGLTRGTKCKFFVMLGSAASSYRALGSSGDIGNAYATRAGELYRQGVDGLSFWDTNFQDKYTATWSVLRRLGHADELKAGVFKPRKVRSITLKKVGGIDVSFKHDAWYYV